MAVWEVRPGLLDGVLGLSVLPKVDDLGQAVEESDIVPAGGAKKECLSVKSVSEKGCLIARASASSHEGDFQRKDASTRFSHTLTWG